MPDTSHQKILPKSLALLSRRLFEAISFHMLRKGFCSANNPNLNDNDVDNGINNQYNKDFYSVHDNSAKYHPIPNLSADPEKRRKVQLIVHQRYHVHVGASIHDREKEIFGEDLADVISMMTSLPDRVHTATRFQSETARWTATKDLVEKSASLFDRIIELNETWHDIIEKRRPLVGTHLLSTIDGLGLILADAMAEKIEEQSVIGKNMALQVVRSDYGEPVQLPQWDVTTQYSHKGKVMLEKGYDTHLNPEEGNISVVFTLYSDLASILSPDQIQNDTCSSGTLNSAVMSATVSQNRNPTSISSPVKIFVEHLIPQPNRTACVFWNMQSNEWDTKGCHLESSNGTYRCTLSIICLAICVVVFSFYSYHSKHSWGLRYVIHRNLCLTLLVANLILVIGLDKTDYPRWCTVIAGMLHYFFLAAFSWMLLEAVHIYSAAGGRLRLQAISLGEILFVWIWCPIDYCDHHSHHPTDILWNRRSVSTLIPGACWLSTEKGVIWAFMGPVACILLLNLAALILAQWKASNISVKDDNVALFKRWLRVTFILFPVLGITWIFGFLFVGKHFEVAGYLFAFFNSFQGFCIFICHCLMDKKARNLVLSSLKKKSSSVATGSTGTQKKQNSTCQNGHNKPDTEKKSIPHTFQNACRRNWNKLHKPWSFCFDMPVSERGSQDIRKEHEEIPPKPRIVQWNNLQDKVT
ncbi:adhesion G protein-coupled receptor L1 [Trichonephila inaurata madagascariensis]|uniref:Adhesion G protein-coupled receptor L1 n=1 Tax=Trichonephila inaurata madagascariensis TaxID=2747483 RepID=A0A8X6KMI6_9ARAC|nr:adhesion G protein-coupled receptor L1 [Trichonephila inaurata madagascariensis]